MERYFQFELYKLFRFYTKISNLLLKNNTNNNKKPRFQIYLKNKSLEFFLSNFVKKKIFIFTKKKRQNINLVTFLVRGPLLGRLSIGPVLNRLGRWLNRRTVEPLGSGGSGSPFWADYQLDQC